MARLREQQRASEALAFVEKVACEVKAKEANDICQELQQLPARILSSGLGQTLAFYASKGGVHDRLGGELARFLTAGKSQQTIDFLRSVMTDSDVTGYRRRTREALAYAEWLKRYAKAILRDEDASPAR